MIRADHCARRSLRKGGGAPETTHTVWKAPYRCRKCPADEPQKPLKREKAPHLLIFGFELGFGPMGVSQRLKDSQQILGQTGEAGAKGGGHCASCSPNLSPFSKCMQAHALSPNGLVAGS